MENIYKEVIDNFNYKLNELEIINPKELKMYLCLNNLKSVSFCENKQNVIEEFKKAKQLLGFPENQKKTKLIFGEVIDENYILKALKQQTEPIFALHRDFIKEIKNCAKREGLCANHVSTALIEDLFGDSLVVSKDRLTQFQQKRGDFLFATTLKDRKDLYCVRNCGMIRLSKNSYLFLSTDNYIIADRFKLKKPKTVFKFDVDEFTPETMFAKTKKGNFEFLFDDEWYCDHNIKVLDEKGQPTCDVEVVDDVTDALDNYHIYISKNDRMALKTLDSKNFNEHFGVNEALKYCVKKGFVTDVNAMIKKNTILKAVNKVIIDEQKAATVNVDVKNKHKDKMTNVKIATN